MAAGGLSRVMVMVAYAMVVAANGGTQAETSRRIQERPHLIYVLADDLGHANVGWNNPAVMTPHLNDLRDSGVALERYTRQKTTTKHRQLF
eukprot:m.147479 g.147479  ORF g.147479 m.147479 type:complete len:91 (+) comp17287_c0_seq3:92-364(+)